MSSSSRSPTSFRVWAPAAGRVELELAGTRFAMTRAERGWWTTCEEARPGDDYAFVLDGSPPLPDPRSPWQPDGVHGRSRLVDPEAFRWTDDGWCAGPLRSAVFYELHVGTFTPGGTFEAAIEKLPHLVDLGVTHIELMPLAQFPGARGWGYDGVDLYAPHHGYGGPQGLQAFVDACHSRGLAVILDVVYNHLGPSGNHLSRYGPYFTDRYHTPWGRAVNLDGAGSDEVRRFLCDNALAWLRHYHLDGLRLDAVHAFFDSSALPFLEQLAVEVQALEGELGRKLVLIAESDRNDPRLVRGRDAFGLGLDAQWADDVHHALHAYLTGERHGYYVDFGTLGDLAKALQDVFVMDGRHSTFRGRRHGRPALGVPRDRFLAYMQNHDQVGNRAKGERSGHLLSPARLKLAAALVLTSPFVPLLFQGEEWGARTPFHYFTDHDDADLARAVREGRRREFAAFGWRPEEVPDPQDPRTFEASRLDWSEPERAPHREILDWHRRLVGLRHHPAAVGKEPSDGLGLRFDEAAEWLVYERGGLTVAFNFAGQTRCIPLRRRHVSIALHSAPVEPTWDAEGVSLPADAVAILRSEKP